jgi:hypothetical protein
MKKLTILLLTITLFSCQVFKNFTKEKSKEENKTETIIKVDSLTEVQKEQEIVSTFADETKTEFFDLSEVTIFEVMNDSGIVKERTTTTKTKVKTNKVEIGQGNTLVFRKEQNKFDKKTLIEQKNQNKNIQVKKHKKVEKTSLPNWLWILLIIIAITFILVAVWKLKNKWLIN